MKRILLFTLISFFAFSIKAQEISESFESGIFPPAGWEIFVKDLSKDFDDVTWEISDTYAHTGTNSAYSGWYDVDEEGWMVTPLYTPTNDNHTLYFFQSQFDAGSNYDSEFTIRVSSVSQTTTSDFTIIDAQSETDFGEEFSIHEVDLTAYIGTAIYIAFVHDTNFDGDNWYIDDVRTEFVAVPEPTIDPIPINNAIDVLITNSQTSVIDFSWDAATTGTPAVHYDFYVGADQTNLPKLGSRIVTDAHPSTFHFNTTYYWKAVAVNTGGEAIGSDIWNFTTISQPTVTAPYTIDFENDGNVPDGCDQLVANEDWWEYSNDVEAGHVGNDGDIEGTSTESGGYFAKVDDSPPNSQNTSFLTPFVDVTSQNEPTISFYMISHNEGATNVTLSVNIWDGAAWNEMFTSNTNTAGWELKTIDLTSLTITGAIQLKLVVTEDLGDTYNDDLAIDDIKFYDANPIGIQNINVVNKISIFPNPANDFINISSDEDVQKVDIYNITGKKVLGFSTYKKGESLNIKNLSKGTYFINIISETKNRTLKFEKR